MSPKAQFPSAIVPDAAQLVLRETGATQSRDLMLLTHDADRRLTPLAQTSFDERNGVVSPDGRWLAYESNSSGQSAASLFPYPVHSSRSSKAATTWAGMAPG